MEKLKNLLKPGKTEDDQTLYGTGQSSGAHSGGVTGEGSHLGGATNTSQSTNPISSSHPHTSGTGNTGLANVTDHSTQHGPHAGQGSHFSSATSGQTSNLPVHSSGVTTTTTTQTHTGQSHVGGNTGLTGTGNTGIGHSEHGHQGHQSGLGSAEIGTGLGHNQNSGISSGTTSGPHTSDLANRVDPRVDSDNSRNTGLGHTHGSALPGSNLGSAASNTHSGNTHNTGTHLPGSSHLPQTSQTGANPNYAQGSSDHHLGRDAGIVGGAGVLGAGAHSHNEHGHTHVPATSGPHNTYAANVLDPAVNTRAPGGFEDAHHHTASGGGAEEADAHHGGKLTESALALGQNRHNQPGTGVGVGSSTGPAPHTAGPHQKDIANVVDPRVNPNNAAGLGAQAQAGSHATTHTSGHHYGRDAAIGAGGVGAAGLVGSQHHNNQTGSGIGHQNTTNIHQSTTGASGLPGPAAHTAGPHNSDLMNKADPRFEANPTAGQGYSQSQSSIGHHDGSRAGHSSLSHEKEYNYGRDTAITGGATSAFVGSGHHDHGATSGASHVGQHGASTTTHDPHSTSSTQRSTVDPTTGHSTDHHLGRDAAVVGGAAGVGGAAHHEHDKHKREKELEKSHREAEKEHKHDLKQAEKEHKIEEKRAEKHAEKDHKHAEKDEKKKHGFLSFLHRDKSKKYSAEEEADFDRQEREHNASQSHAAHTGHTGHTGHSSSLGTTVVGGVPLEVHHDVDNNKALPTAPGNHGVGTGAGTQNALAGHTSSGHDSATQGTPLPLKPAGRDIGDILHGTERNRGVTGASGFPNQPGFGDGTHPHAHSEATTDQHGHPVGYGTTGTAYGSQKTGREFPLGHSQHDSNSPLHSTSHHHNTGREAAALGGAGLVGEHEHRKHDATTGQHSGLTGSHGSSALSDNQQHSGVTGSHGSSALSENQQHSGLTGSHGSSALSGNQQHSGLTGSHGSSALSGNQQHSGLTGSHEHSTLSGQQHSGLTGSHGSSALSGNQQHSGLTGSHGSSALSGNQQHSGLTGSHEHSTLSGQQHSGLTGSHGSSGLSGNQTTSGYPTGHETSGLGSSTGQYDNGSSGLSGSHVSDLSGRNKLHKDPPAGHPAAQGYGSGTTGTHVPAGGAEREHLVEQGKDHLGHDTGVANAQPHNSSTNY